jgi:hypothetical protein
VTSLQLATILLFAAADAEPTRIVSSEFVLTPPAPSLRTTPQDCRRSAGVGEIVVCGRSQEEYRAREIRPPKGIEVDEGGVVGLDLAGSRIEPSLSQVTMPDGRISKRFMVTVKVPF